jgi:hypothetical protein
VKNYTNKTTTVYGANMRKVSDELVSENKWLYTPVVL